MTGSAPTITIPASLASGAHQLGEETHLVVYCVARSIDVCGSGRVLLTEITPACADIVSGRQLRRVLYSDQGTRYWDVELRFLRLHSSEAVLCSFPCEVLASNRAVRLEAALLNSRQRRGAALLAAVLAGTEAPRSNAFISRFAGVDRQTVSRWMEDPVVRGEILRRVPERAVVQ